MRTSEHYTLPGTEPLGDDAQNISVGFESVVKARCVHKHYASPALLIPESDGDDLTCTRFHPMANRMGL